MELCWHTNIAKLRACNISPTFTIETLNGCDIDPFDFFFGKVDPFDFHGGFVVLA